VYFQQLEQKVEKQVELKKLEKIKEYLVYLEYMNEEDLKKNLNVDKMKSILYQWKTEGYYEGDLSILKKNDLLDIFWSAIVNTGFIELE